MIICTQQVQNTGPVHTNLIFMLAEEVVNKARKHFTYICYLILKQLHMVKFRYPPCTEEIGVIK